MKLFLPTLETPSAADLTISSTCLRIAHLSGRPVHWPRLKKPPLVRHVRRANNNRFRHHFGLTMVDGQQRSRCWVVPTQKGGTHHAREGHTHDVHYDLDSGARVAWVNVQGGQQDWKQRPNKDGAKDDHQH
eukprot:GEMP01048686.1.p4 GENE.GEMP01048686.1~~GEMP01048686.1.p4  ORF type:complete len:131 (-),score=29.98 GEMP01048686.1:644-1036(-)